MRTILKLNKKKSWCLCHKITPVAGLNKKVNAIKSQCLKIVSCWHVDADRSHFEAFKDVHIKENISYRSWSSLFANISLRYSMYCSMLSTLPCIGQNEFLKLVCVDSSRNAHTKDNFQFNFLFRLQSQSMLSLLNCCDTIQNMLTVFLHSSLFFCLG